MDDKKDEQMAEANAAMMSDDESDGTWDDVDEELELHILCLFCPQVFKTMAIALEHCKVEHHFNLLEIKMRFDMDCYSYIRMINYIRKENVPPEALNSYDMPWCNDIYLTPVIVDDPWLMYDFEGLELPTNGEIVESNGITRLPKSALVNENEIVCISQSSFNYLQNSLKFYADEILKKDTMLSSAYTQINEMRTIVNKIFSGEATREEGELENKILTLRLSEDNGYFKTYSHFGVHLEMLSDEVRMLSFRDAIYMNRSMFSGKIVLDVGCGSGILSLFCACADAGKVYGVDQSEIIYHANDIVRENNYSTKIELIHGKIEEVTLPVEKVDFIVSEWLGYFLLFEGMLDSVLHARDKYLKPDGRILPDHCSLHIAGISDQESYDKMIKFWKDVYGFRMPSLAKEVLQEAAVLDVAPDSVATTSAKVFELDLYVHNIENTNFTSEFSLESFITGELTALCGYFVADFNLPHKVGFSTSPNHPKTHWKQTVFFLPTPIQIKKGDILKGQIDCKRKPEDKRSLVITIQIENHKHVYLLA